MTHALHYEEFEPSANVAEVALVYSCFTVHEVPSSDFVHRVWPDGCVSLTFVCIGTHCVAARVLGVRMEAAEVPIVAGARYWSVRFRPESGAAWMSTTPQQLRDRNVDAAELLGAAVMRTGADVARCTDADAVCAILDTLVLSRAERVQVDEVVQRAVSSIAASEGAASIAAIADDVGMNMRTLQRRFRTAVGLTPKEYSQIRRTRATLKRVVFDPGVGTSRWSEIAMDSGYADQAHMTRELARLTRFTPTRLREQLDTIAHERIVD